MTGWGNRPLRTTALLGEFLKVGSMEETTTTEPTEDQTSGVDDSTQLEAAVDEAGSQPETGDAPDNDSEDESEDTPDTSDDDEVKSWAEKKNLPLDDPLKLAKMVRESEQKMHQATKDTKLKEAITAPKEVDQADTQAVWNERLEQLEAKNSVTDFYLRNPEARSFDAQMAKEVQAKPYLAQDLDALYAVVRFNELNTDDIKSAGGREALENLAQRQKATAVKGNATNSRITSNTRITSKNVDQLVAANSQDWFVKHYDEINAAMSHTWEMSHTWYLN